jgi:hypothetical protein
MNIKYLFLTALATLTLAGCTSDEFMGDTGTNDNVEDNGAIYFGLNMQNATRAGELTGATAAEKLGGMFVVEGTKGEEKSNSPSLNVVFDNYLVGYTENTAGTTESNTHNWEYVGLQSGITGKLSGTTWTNLHAGTTDAKSQTIKYWDYTQDQYDFIAWSTGHCEAVTTTATDGHVQVTRINTGSTLATNGFQMTAVDADDLLECYYTDINTVTKTSGKYGQPVTLTFRNMAAKVRVALYETVPGYSVRSVEFYQAEATDPTAPDDLAADNSTNPATLFTTGSDELPQSGTVTVLYPRIGTSNSSAVDYNKASVTVSPGSSTDTKQKFGTLTAQYGAEEANEATGNIYLGRDINHATFAGAAADNFYTAVIPNTNGYPLTLRVNYTLVATDGSGETIKIYGAKAVVPATYTVWLPNYAYTYIFKISDNTNGWTSTTSTDPQGLFPITFDAVVTSFTDVNAEQTTVTTVATPSITTYQQGHTYANNEYSKSQKAGVSAEVKDVYVQVMNNSGATPTLKADLNGSKKSLLFAVTTAGTAISEATVMDAMQNRTNHYSDDSPVGRNGITLTSNANIANNVESIINGVDDQPITVTAGQAAKIDIDQLDAGTYAYVYCETVPSADEVIYNLVASTTAQGAASSYYEVAPCSISAVSGTAAAEANKVYFIKTTDADGGHVTYTFKQTKVGDDVTGLYVATPAQASSYTAGNFYFALYNQNNGFYAVKVIKVVN